MSSNIVKLVLYVALAGLGPMLVALAHAEPAWTWVAMASSMVAALGAAVHVDPPATAARMAKLAAKVSVILFGSFAVGGTMAACLTSGNAVQAGVASVELAVCILNTYSADHAAGKSDAQAVADTITRCATDATTIATVLDASHAAEQKLAAK